MTRDIQKAQERAALAHFGTLVPLPEGEIDGDNEKPDFVINGTVKVGIEVTRLNVAEGEFSWQAQKPRRADALKIARSQYLSLGSPRFDFNFDFKPLAGDVTIKEIAKQAIIAAKIAGRGGGGLVPSYRLQEEAPLVTWLYRTPDEYPEARWVDLPSFSVPFLNPESVQNCVKKKGQKLKQYRICDEQWLLIYVDFWDPAQDQELFWPTGAELVRHGFDRVFIIKTHHLDFLEPYSLP